MSEALRGEHWPQMVSLSEAARALGVSTNQVWSWHTRAEARRRAGRVAPDDFPAPGGSRRWGSRQVPLFALDAVVDWRRRYVPSTRPRIDAVGRRAPAGAALAEARRRAERRDAAVTRPDGSLVARAPGWLTKAALARALGVSPVQVSVWVARGGGNGFPAPVGTVPLLGGSGTRDLYDVAAVREWAHRHGRR